LQKSFQGKKIETEIQHEQQKFEKETPMGAINLGICFLSLFAISDGIPQKYLKNQNSFMNEVKKTIFSKKNSFCLKIFFCKML